VDVVQFAVLGLGAGAVYGLTAQGVVLIYRGSGVVNFAQGAIGMIGAYVVYLSRQDGVSTPVAVAGGIGLGAAIGALTHLLVMRPLREAPAVSRLVASLGILSVGLALGQQLWGNGARLVAALLPTSSVTVLGGVAVGENRLLIFALALVVTAGLTLLYRTTRFGLATSAVTESRRATSAQGISPDVIATINWALGGALAVAAAVLIVSITGLQVLELTLLVVPALAAALVGGFRSFPLTLIGGLLIGVLESEIAYLQVSAGTSQFLQGAADSVPFVVIIVVLVARGRPLPLRGEVLERPPELGTGMVRPSWVMLLTAGALAVAVFAPSGWVAALTMTAAVGVILLSLVVVTGYAGQLSLAQMALAGLGAWIAARLAADHGVPFELAALAGIAGAVPIGVLVGLAALRTRGINLAVATLGLALLLQSQVLDNQSLTGGVMGTQIGSPRFLGIDVDTLDHPGRYCVLATAVFLIAFLAVANLRRSRTGRRLIAVRTNERAAAALGVSVFGAKLYAFGLAAALAAAGGVLIAFQTPTVTFLPTFDVVESIWAVLYAVIGGIGAALGALAGAGAAPGTVGATAFSLLGQTPDQLFRLFGGLLLIAVLLQDPNGLVSFYRKLVLRYAARLRLRRNPARQPSIALPGRQRVRPAPATLELHGLTVRFGGVTALDAVSLTVSPGEVVGLIGPNGAGKTTLIDAVTGYVTADAGTILLDGRAIGEWSPRRRAVAGIGRLFQSLELFESPTVAENLQTACDPRDRRYYLSDLIHPGRAQLGPAAVAAVRDFGLQDDLASRPDELPYGRRRLVAIARAIASGPSVLLLDEPAAGLDRGERSELARIIRRLADQWGLAVLVVEHDVPLVLETCDRVAVLDAGVQIAQGKPGDVAADPAVVASYLGAEGAAAPARRPRAVRSDVVLRAEGLCAGYGGLAAVRELDLTVCAGEIVALLGSNGAGKSTTLLTLAGELPPLAGRVTCLGRAHRDPLYRRVRAGLALVPEEHSVFGSLTVGANLRLAPGPGAVAPDLFPELRPLLGRRAGSCSGGEQQILALACALAGRPRLLLVDELSLGLAPFVVRRLLKALREAADERGTGILLVEQHARQALQVADRAYVLHRGRIVMDGPAAGLLDDPEALERAYLHGTEA
jgi:ABC-type branched-subunit amino acid transport system ATPase component/branched-subunit amino acid ABC-type transport system permease component